MNDELKQHMGQYLAKGMRFDGRKFEEYRPITVAANISKSAEGSARVTIGKTDVIVGVKFEIGKPFPDKPDEGSIAVGAELLPLSNPEFEMGPPSIQAVELARVIDRGIRESHYIDFHKLCITSGESMWMLSIDIVTVNDAGNLFDAAGLAAIAALQNARFPTRDGEDIDYKHLTNDKLPLTKSLLPISITVYKIGDVIIVDPTNEEEKAMDARLTVASMPNGQICALQKGGNGALSVEEIDAMIAVALKKAKELAAYVQ